MRKSVDNYVYMCIKDISKMSILQGVFWRKNLKERQQKGFFKDKDHFLVNCQNYC